MSIMLFRNLDGSAYADSVATVFIVTCFCCGILLISTSYDSSISVTSNDIVKFTILWISSLLSELAFGTVNLSLLGSLFTGIILNAFDFNT